MMEKCHASYGNSPASYPTRVACWGRLAEVTNQYLSKGRMVMVTAKRIVAEPYIDKEGKPRAALKVTADTVKFLDAAENARDEETGEMPF